MWVLWLCRVLFSVYGQLAGPLAFTPGVFTVATGHSTEAIDIARRYYCRHLVPMKCAMPSQSEIHLVRPLVSLPTSVKAR